MTGASLDRRATAWRPGQVVVLFVLLALLAGLARLVVDEPQRSWQGGAAYGLTLAGGHYRVDGHQLAWLQSFTALHFGEGEARARALARAEIDARLDQAFVGVSARLPEFADWYYSLAGEYARLSMLALSWVDLADDDYVARRASAILFPEGAWDVDLAALEEQTARRLANHHQRVRSGWLDEVTARLAPARVPAPLTVAEPGDEALGLDLLLNRMLERERAALTARVTVASVAAGGAVAGPMVWRAASRRLAAAGRPLVARAVGRGAARAGSAAAGGATVCAPGGPLAIGCAVAAGAAAWVAADWALLRIDEALHRDELIAALEESLSSLREEVRADLLVAYDALIARQYDALQQEIRDSFVPLAAR